MNIQEILEVIKDKKLISMKEIENVKLRWFHANRVESSDVKLFLKWLVLNKFLSEFQAQMLVSGRVGALKIEDYNVLEIIKTGAYTGSLRAQSPLGEQFIIQFIRDEVIKDRDLLKKFLGQLQTGVKISHPNLATLVEKGQCNGHMFIVREFIEGDSLDVIISKRGKIQYQSAAKIMAIVMNAVAFVQEKSLPAGNLLLSDVILAVNKNQPKGPKTVKIVNNFISPSMISAEVKVSQDGFFVPSSNGLSLQAGIDLSLVDENLQVGKLLYSSLVGKRSSDFEKSVSVPAVSASAPEVPEQLASLAEQMLSSNVSERPAKIAHAAKVIRVFLAAEEEGLASQNDEYIAVPYVPTVPVIENVEARNRLSFESVKGGNPEDEDFSIKKIVEEFRPDVRDLTFLGLGSVLSLLLVSFLHLITGWHFMSLVCLIVGGVISYSVELFSKWRNQQDNQVLD